MTNTSKWCMAFTVAAFFVVSSGVKGAETGPVWLENYDTAVAESKKTGKPLLVNFTGSDWCGWCIRLKSEVFSKAEFGEWVDKNVVLLELDFPNRKPQTAEIKAQNAKLSKTYGIRGFPTILFLSADGKVIGKSGYMQGGPDVWTANAQTIIGKITPKKTSRRKTKADPTAAKDLAKNYKGKLKLPEDLYNAYAAFVLSARAGGESRLRAHCLPNTVTVTTKNRNRRKRKFGTDMNTSYLKDGFNQYIVTVTKDSDDTYMIRTSTSFLRLVLTGTTGWKVYSYGDKPIK